MRIGIDARLYNQTGVGVYIRNLLYYLQKIASEDIEFFIYILPSPNNKLQITNYNFKIKYINAKWHSLNEQVGFYRQLMADNLDLMHFTYFSYPILYKKPFIITIHDLTPLLFKTGKASTHNHLTYNMKHVAYKYLIGQAVKNSKVIITPTDFVKSQIALNFPNIPKTKISVTYEGINYELSQLSLRGVRYRLVPDDVAISKPFFIYVGNFYPHKNVEKLIDAFSDLCHCEPANSAGEAIPASPAGGPLKSSLTPMSLRATEGSVAIPLKSPSLSDYRLILLGPNDYFCKKIKQLINQKGLENKIIIYNNSSLSDLIFFYQNATALIHPSLSEGFGLPILEAQYFKLPIIASDIPVFKEIVGDNYYSFNPNNIEDIKKTIEDFIRNPNKKKTSKINPNFSFEKMSKKTLSLYKQFSNGN